MAVFFLVLYLYVGKFGTMESTKVNQAFTPVNKAIVPHFLEGFVGLFDDFLVQFVDVMFPVNTSAQATELLLVVITVLSHKIPNLAIQLFPAEIKTALALFG